MDPNYVIAVTVAFASVLLGLNVVFLKNLFTKIETSWLSAAVTDSKIKAIERQLEDISIMKTDVGILKSEILKYLNHR